MNSSVPCQRGNASKRHSGGMSMKKPSTDQAMTNSMLYAQTTDSAYSKKIGHIIDWRSDSMAGAYLISAWMPPLAQRSRCL